MRGHNMFLWRNKKNYLWIIVSPLYYLELWANVQIPFLPFSCTCTLHYLHPTICTVTVQIIKANKVWHFWKLTTSFYLWNRFEYIFLHIHMFGIPAINFRASFGYSYVQNISNITYRWKAVCTKCRFKKTIFHNKCELLKCSSYCKHFNQIPHNIGKTCLVEVFAGSKRKS